jgi:2-polyprenyl-6-methoxyphenol hydroxylase-like FAD-dependent oxidoreductase
MDVEWFRLPRCEHDPANAIGRLTRDAVLVLIDRGDCFQIGYLIKKGTDRALRDAGIVAFRSRIALALPWLADRVDAVESLEDVQLLTVRLSRLRRWYADGLLLIGDAAHAMSPVGGVGINLAVQDAVAAARILAPALQTGERVPVSVLRRVQLRRWWPTALVQGAQRLAHRQILRPALEGDGDQAAAAPEQGHPGAIADPEREAPTSSLPIGMRLLRRFPVLQGIPARAIAIGPLPEHAPDWAQREPTPVQAPAPQP